VLSRLPARPPLSQDVCRYRSSPDQPAPITRFSGDRDRRVERYHHRHPHAPPNDRRSTSRRSSACPSGASPHARRLYPIPARRPQSARFSYTLSGATTAARITSGIRRTPEGALRSRTPDRNIQPAHRRIGTMTGETNLQHCVIDTFETHPAASYIVLRDSVPPLARLGSNGGGMPRATPCSAGVDTADGSP
jgi:hypothetical protein